MKVEHLIIFHRFSPGRKIYSGRIARITDKKIYVKDAICICDRSVITPPGEYITFKEDIIINITKDGR